MAVSFDLNPSQMYMAVLGREPSSEEMARTSSQATDASGFPQLHQLLGSAEFTHLCLREVLAIHLLLIHAARVKLVCK